MPNQLLVGLHYFHISEDEGDKLYINFLVFRLTIEFFQRR